MQAPAAEEPAAPSAAAEQTQPAAETAEAAAAPPEAAAQQEDGSKGSAAALPLPYVADADGKKQPLAGAKSIFIRGKLIMLASGLSTTFNKHFMPSATNSAVDTSPGSKAAEQHNMQAAPCLQQSAAQQSTA